MATGIEKISHYRKVTQNHIIAGYHISLAFAANLTGIFDKFRDLNHHIFTERLIIMEKYLAVKLAGWSISPLPPIPVED